MNFIPELGGRFDAVVAARRGDRDKAMVGNRLR
jgi:hypothetical protein